MYHIGIDMGGTFIKTGVVDDNYQIVARHSVPTDGAFETTVREMVQAAAHVASMVGMKIDDFPSIGVCLPSCINPATGRLVFSNNTNWSDVPLLEELQKYVSIPIYIANDADCAVIGETLGGGAKGAKNVLMYTLGTGVGGGIIRHGKLFLTGDGLTPEPGHTAIMHGGEYCTCGISGCLEAYASLAGLRRMTQAAMDAHPESTMHEFIKTEDNAITGRTAFDCAKAGDPAATEVVDTYCRYLANGIGSLTNIFRPEKVIVGGGISNAGDFLFDRLNSYLPEYVFASDLLGCPKVERAVLGNDAGTIGAAYLEYMQ